VAEIDDRLFPEGSYAYLRGRRNSKRVLAVERSLRNILKRLNSIEDDLEEFYEVFGFFPINDGAKLPSEGKNGVGGEDDDS